MTVASSPMLRKAGHAGPATRSVGDREVSQHPERVFELEGWTVHEVASVDSTNLFAAKLPVWHAVRAEVQTAGRGRFQRVWISDQGGLWLSAVVPSPPRTREGRVFRATTRKTGSTVAAVGRRAGSM
jgi:hypothetical protein